MELCIYLYVLLLYRVFLNKRKILRDDSLLKIKEDFSYKHKLYPSLWSYIPPKMEVKIRFLFFFKFETS